MLCYGVLGSVMFWFGVVRCGVLRCSAHCVVLWYGVLRCALLCYGVRWGVLFMWCYAYGIAMPCYVVCGDAMLWCDMI